MKKYKVTVIGARGYVGNELLPLLGRHENIEISAVSSRELAGQVLYQHIKGIQDKSLQFESIASSDIKDKEHIYSSDIFFLALPDGLAKDYVKSIQSLGSLRKNKNQPIIIDISADHRFSPEWIYGLPELDFINLTNAKKIANPGCYATACMLGLAPLKEKIINCPNAFGVSGFSGAGKTPSDKNNLELLKDNLMPYKLAGHKHELEVSHHLGRQINFMPHVFSGFRGLSVTLNLDIDMTLSKEYIQKLYTDYYSNHHQIIVTDDVPQLRDIKNNAGAIIGGFNVDTRSKHNMSNVRIVVVLDNLLKGAASQAIQNMNLALGLSSLTGLKHLLEFAS